MEFIVGQRWISHTESQLGLGIVSEVSGRLISIKFPSCAEERSYAVNNAPLTRVIYKVGDKVKTNDELKVVIKAVNNRSGIIFYNAVDEGNAEHNFTELDLDSFVTFNSPDQRLLTNLFDSNALYQLRIDTLQHTHRLQQSPVKGLLGSRTSLLPHQIYIASEVAKRFAPRVLLADEVGLGKTIEAGMILHQQLHTGQASRVLILVPDTLIHQWLVEMLRKFNLRFSIFDQQRFDALLEESPESNPFETEQLIICSLDFLTSNPDALEHSLDAEWDLLIVDEAHHLQWSPEVEQVSPEYQAVELLSEASVGVLLLTATPEQMGIESHFARLRLLDPARFFDLTSFVKEEAGYEKLATIVCELQAVASASNKLEAKHFTKLKPYLGQELKEIQSTNVDNENLINLLIEKLLDRHGTGRVLFRNTRAAIDDFPERQLLPHALEKPADYPSDSLYPELETSDDSWCDIDPRVDWLQQLLKSIKPEKVLIICANASTAKTLEHFLQIRCGIRSAAFYEQMSIVERDSAAAYFADPDTGAQALVCSEIGSEGRNFQFAHHLVLFDLPLNPDLLEQRIGRLDRIGQIGPIQIHVPYFKNTAQNILFDWFNQGIQSFTRSCSIATSIYQKFEAQLQQLLHKHDAKLSQKLIQETTKFTEQSLASMEQGRDPLLELNSCNPSIAHQLIEKIHTESEQATITQYSNKLFDLFGLEQEEHSEHATIIHPTDHMLLDAFPGMGDESMTLTSNRQFALSREDITFLTWEHPILSEAMDMILSGNLGNASIVTLPLKSIPAGTFMLETFHSIRCMAPKELQIEKYLPLNPVRALVNLQGKNLTKALSFEQLNQRCQRMKKSIAQGVLPQIKQQIETMAEQAHSLASPKLQTVIKQSLSQHETAIKEEISRLKALQKHNAGIREEEIEYLETQIKVGQHFINKANVQCEGMRVIITT